LPVSHTTEITKAIQNTLFSNENKQLRSMIGPYSEAKDGIAKDQCKRGKLDGNKSTNLLRRECNDLQRAPMRIEQAFRDKDAP